MNPQARNPLGDLGEVMHYYPQTYPSSYPILAMVGAALQSVLPPEYANPSFNARSEGESSPALIKQALSPSTRTTE